MFAVASVLLGYAAVLSTVSACQYTERPATVVSGNALLRVPIQSGAGAQDECATTAEAFGITTASIVAGKPEGSGSQCVLFGDQSTGCGIKYEMLDGAVTLTNIKGCDAKNVKAVLDAALMLAGAGEPGKLGVNTTATKVANTAAVGKAVYSDLSFLTEEECLVACSAYVKGCTHVTVVVAPGQMAKCSFHGSPSQGVQYQGASTYYNIMPNPTFAMRSLGAASSQLAGSAPAVATPTAAAAAIPAAPVAVAPVPVAPVAAAPAPVAVANGSIEALITTPPGMCPGPLINAVPVGKHQTELEVPDKVIAEYTDILGTDGTFQMPYPELINGGEYCVAKGSTVEKFYVGGTFLWDAGDGTCELPPVNELGESCCEVYMWQPNSLGYYYDNCSMKMKIQPDGVYYFMTEMPGDESAHDWGPDPEAHIHFDVYCAGCADHPIVKGDYNFFNKFYPEELCLFDEAECGIQGPQHQATLKTVGGKKLYHYDFVLPGASRVGTKGTPP